jgi:hypothetical protein
MPDTFFTPPIHACLFPHLLPLRYAEVLANPLQKEIQPPINYTPEDLEYLQTKVYPHPLHAAFAGLPLNVWDALAKYVYIVTEFIFAIF